MVALSVVAPVPLRGTRHPLEESVGLYTTQGSVRNVSRPWYARRLTCRTAPSSRVGKSHRSMHSRSASRHPRDACFVIPEAAGPHPSGCVDPGAPGMWHWR